LIVVFKRLQLSTAALPRQKFHGAPADQEISRVHEFQLVFRQV
jgi:hypothetical protein